MCITLNQLSGTEKVENKELRAENDQKDTKWKGKVYR